MAEVTARAMDCDRPAAPAGSDDRRKRVFLKTYGCQMNVYDSERMSEALAADGYEPTEDPAAADVVILNTCHIREKAADKVYSDLGRLRTVKAERAASGLSTIVAVAGCVAQAEGDEIIRREAAVDLVVGPQATHRLAALVRDRIAAPDLAPVVETDFADEDKFTTLPTRPAKRTSAAFLTVQEGCDKFCTFCVVPYTRGAEFSRPVGQIAAEARALVEGGVRELTLLGQNVNAYHGIGPDGRVWSLAALIEHLASIENLDRIRYTTSHPRDMSEDLIGAHAVQAKLMPYLHLPFQSGADRILAAMNRKHTADDYLRLVENIRRARPDIALSTDVIVGFPGESEAEFECTLDLVRSVGFVQAFAFKYSARPGTPATSLADPVPDEIKADRLARLQALLAGQTTAFNASCVGKVLPVLFEKPGRQDGQLIGRSPYLQSVFADADRSLLGTVVPVKIASVFPHSLEGRLVA
jgi:tRNA-2-methylthio-N6-dimethylallyladenosine synthase